MRTYYKPKGRHSKQDIIRGDTNAVAGGCTVLDALWVMNTLASCNSTGFICKSPSFLHSFEGLR